MERVLQDHSGYDVHHLLQTDIIGVPVEKECAKLNVKNPIYMKEDKTLLRPSLLKRVDLNNKIVTADVFLQTSLQSPQHLHLEHYTWGHQRRRVRKMAILNSFFFPKIFS